MKAGVLVLTQWIFIGIFVFNVKFCFDESRWIENNGTQRRWVTTFPITLSAIYSGFLFVWKSIHVHYLRFTNTTYKSLFKTERYDIYFVCTESTVSIIIWSIKCGGLKGHCTETVNYKETFQTSSCGRE